MRSLLGRFHRPNARSQSEQLFMLNNLGDGSTLSLDFTTGVLDPRLTFTRSTTGTYIGSDGLIKTMAAAPTNDPTKARFDYDPITLTPRGLLIEGSAVNYMLESTSLSGYSNTNMVAVTSGTETDPEGNANSAKQIYATSGALNYHGFFRSTTAGTNTQITISIWAKARNYTFLFLSDLATGRASVRFNLNTGATDNNFGAGFVSAKATPFPNNWWRCEMVVNVTASTAYAWAFGGTPSGATLNGFGTQYAGTGNAADGIYCYGFQVEAGSGASSYIPTVASTGNRAADDCQLLNLTTMGFNASEGTIYTDVGVRLNTGSQRNYTFLPASGSNNQIFEGSGTALNVYSSGSFVAQIGTSPLSASKIAAGYAVNDYAVSVNGAAVVTDTSGALPSSLTKLTIGGSIVNAAAYANGCIRTFKYWPTRLPNAQLQALTT